MCTTCRYVYKCLFVINSLYMHKITQCYSICFNSNSHFVTYVTSSIFFLSYPDMHGTVWHYTKPSLIHKGHLASLVDWLLVSISADMERLAPHKSFADAQGLYLLWLSLCHRLSGPEIITDESFGHQAQHFVDNSYL